MGVLFDAAVEDLLVHFAGALDGQDLLVDVIHGGRGLLRFSDDELELFESAFEVVMNLLHILDCIVRLLGLNLVGVQDVFDNVSDMVLKQVPVYFGVSGVLYGVADGVLLVGAGGPSDGAQQVFFLRDTGDGFLRVGSVDGGGH